MYYVMKNFIELPVTNRGYIAYNGKVQAITINRIECNHADGADVDFTEYVIHANVGGEDNSWKVETFPTIYPTATDCINHTNPVRFAENFILGRRFIKNAVGRICNDIFYIGANNEICQSHISEVGIEATPRTIALRSGEETIVWDKNIIGYPKVYATRELAKADRSIIVVEADKSKRIIPSLSSLVALTKEQEYLFGQLEDIMKKINEANMALYVNRDGSDKIYAINKENIGYCESWTEDEDCIGISELITGTNSFQSNFFLFDTDCDEDIFVKR